MPTPRISVHVGVDGSPASAWHADHPAQLVTHSDGALTQSSTVPPLQLPGDVEQYSTPATHVSSPHGNTAAICTPPSSVASKPVVVPVCDVEEEHPTSAIEDASHTARLARGMRLGDAGVCGAPQKGHVASVDFTCRSHAAHGEKVVMRGERMTPRRWTNRYGLAPPIAGSTWPVT